MSTSYDDLLKEQSELVDAIKTIQINFKKDGASRKQSLEYHNERLKKLDSFWSNFEFNDTRLSLLKKEKRGSYYEDQVFEKLQKIYEETKKMILLSKQDLQEKIKQEEMKLREQLAGMDSEEEKIEDFREAHEEFSVNTAQYDEKTVSMINEQKSNVKAFERTVRNLDIGLLSEKWQLEDKLKSLTQRWENIDRLYWKLDNILTEATAHEQTYNRLEKMYETAKTMINNKIWERSHQETSAPKIELPVFTGNYAQWTTFKDLFTETVHQNTFISKSQKMQHLKSKLKGEAERLVQHLSISADNYETCWSILNQRYDNIRLLFTYHANELLNHPTVQQPSAASVKRMHDVIQENLNAIANLKIDTKSWDPLLVHIFLQKLDSETKQSYIESLKNPRDISTLEDFLKFLEYKFMALETNIKQGRSYIEKPSSSEKQVHNSKKIIQNNQQHYNKNSSKTFYNFAIKCPKCTKQHGLYSCKQFLELTSQERLATVNNLGVCKNCLFSHNGENCKSTKKCKECNQSHSTLLHEALGIEQHKSSKQGQRPMTSHVCNDPCNDVLLATAQVEVKTSSGTYIKLRALVDQGSQVTMITEDAAQRLRIKRNKLDAVVSGIGSSPANKCKGVVHLSCKSLYSDFTFETEALIMNKLTSQLPNNNINKTTFKHLAHIELADPDFNISGSIDLLLGADVYSELLLEGLIKVKNSTIVAQQTHLGWIICGKYKTFHCHVTVNNIEDIAKFWEREDIQLESTQENTQQEHPTELFYTATTTRLTDGRYQVRLPLKENIQEKLGTSKSQAIAQFKMLERRMEKNYDFAQSYKSFMKEYEELGHMKVSTNTSKQLLEYFFPHHGIFRPHATTTQLRVVFNGSAKTSTKESLNSLMESGPNLQADLQDIILRWRQYQYVLTADIEKMYRYIAIHPDDQHLQKIIWRESTQQPLTEYQLCTVTYGTKAAPFLALRTLKQLAEDEGNKYPKAKTILLKNFFMDDAIFGCNEVTEAKETRDQLIKLLKSGGFNLRKWASNDPQLVQDLPETLRNPRNFAFTETEKSKTLGLSWSPKKDNFILEPTLKLQTKEKATKREVLSDISSIYDPQGWITPITIKTKILFQDIWKSKVEWDENVPENIQKQWTILRNELTSFKEFEIKRWIGTKSSQEQMQLCAFCDASEKAYACVVYSVIPNNNKNIINIIAAKSRVAPLQKQQTLPRLELCGAQLLTQLVNKIKQCMNIPNIKITAWTDSMVVLGWIKGDVNRWNSFVANRVKEIVKTIPANNWRYVKSDENPADCASRGLLPKQLHSFKLWWEGPEWLQNNNIPSIPENINLQTDKDVKVHIATKTCAEPNIITDLLNKYSNIGQVCRVIAWVLRFITKTRDLNERRRRTSKLLSMQEIRDARTTVIKNIQLTYYKQEITDLLTNNLVQKRSSILKLNPYLDNQGLLRVGGRLEHSYLPENMKHPLIIPEESKLTLLLIREAHITSLHAGARLTLATLRQRYWIIGGSKTIKKHLRTCVTCCRFRSQTQKQIMGNLPAARITPSPPFYHTGVDFTGSVEVKLNKGRGVRTSKGYIAIFVCMVTKAVHLELVSDLSTPTFIMALKRMIARRGCPKNLYSDNGTNFVGADRELHKQIQQLQTIDDHQQFFNDHEIRWHFNAPSWPSAGGLWEAAVKSMKYHLKRVIGAQKLTYEEFSTLLSSIEACLNSRPLSPLTEDIDDLEYLTPGHFLIGRPLTALPQENLTDSNISYQQRWRLTEQMYQHFWRKWSSEYLHGLQVRSKWNKQNQNLKLGDVVIIKDDNSPPTKWSLGRVIETHPGQDDLVRVVTVKTKDGILKRPITKLILLPIDSSVVDNIPEKKEEQKQTEEPNKKRTRTRPSKFTKTSLMCLFVMLVTLFQPTIQENISIQQFGEEKAVYFDDVGKLQNIHDTWKIILFFNMTSYWQGTQNIKKLVQHVESRCNQFEYKPVCQSIVTEMKQQIQELEHNNYILSSQKTTRPSRLPRGLINGVGYIANDLFGVLDSRFAEQYHRDINTLQTNEDHLLKLIKNQTTIIEAHNNILKRNQEIMNQQFLLMEEHLNYTNEVLEKIEQSIEQSENMIYFNIMAMSANLILTKLRSIQEMLLNIATSIRNGQVDHRLLSPEQLSQELNAISGQLPEHLSLPIENVQQHLANIYQLLEVKWAVSDNFFITEIKLPLSNDNGLRVYRIIPIPITRNKTTFIMQQASDYIGVNLRKEIYMTLSETDIASCTRIEPTTLICMLNKPTYNMQSNNTPCEIGLMSNKYTHNCAFIEDTCTDRWIELRKPNSWIYYCCHECAIKLICNERIQAKSAYGAGIIEANSDCVIKHKAATYYTKSLHESIMKINTEIQIPTNDINNIKNPLPHYLPKQRLATGSDVTNTATLQQKIDELKSQSDLNSDLTTHDVHQFAVSYTTLILVVAFVLVAACTYVHWRRTHNSTAAITTIQGPSNIEMTTLSRTVPSRPQPGRPKYARPEPRFNI